MTRLNRFVRDGLRLRPFTVTVLLAVCLVSTQPVAAGTQESVLTLTPSSSGNGVVDLNFASPQYCPGDSEDGYLWQTFITPSVSSPQALTFVLGLPEGPAPTLALRDTFGSWIRNRNPGLDDGRVIPPTQVAITGPAFRSLRVGRYLVGIACTRADDAGVTRTERSWAVEVKISGSPSRWTMSPVNATPTSSTSTTLVSAAGSESLSPEVAAPPTEKSARAEESLLSTVPSVTAKLDDIAAAPEARPRDVFVPSAAEEDGAPSQTGGAWAVVGMVGITVLLLAASVVFVLTGRARSKARAAA